MRLLSPPVVVGCVVAAAGVGMIAWVARPPAKEGSRTDAAPPLETKPTPAKDADAAEVSSLLEIVSLLHRDMVLGDEIIYWTIRQLDAKTTNHLTVEQKKISSLAKEKQAAHIRQYGPNYRGLNKINPKLGERVKDSTDLIREAAKLRLEAGGKLLDLDLELLEAEIRSEVPREIVKTPEFDRSTAEGERKYQEFVHLQPALQAQKDAERNLKLATLSLARHAGVVRTRIDKTHEAILKDLADADKRLAGKD